MLMSDVFILGAGFSKAISPGMPVLAELGSAVRGLLAGSPSAPQMANAPFPDDLELMLTYLSQNHPWQSEAEAARNRALFLDCQDAIGTVIRERERGVFEGQLPEWATGLMQWWSDHESALITLNYDTCVEQLATVLGIEYADDALYGAPIARAAVRSMAVLGGELTAPFLLLKLHGSVHWFYSGGSGFAGEQIYNRHLRSDDGVDDLLTCDKVPLIIPPVADKNSFYANHTLRAIWSQAAAALRNADRVFALGYSLPTTDLTVRYLLTANAPRSAIPMYVVNMAVGTEAMDDGQVQENLRRHYTHGLAGTYEVDARFVSTEEVLPRFVGALSDGELH